MRYPVVLTTGAVAVVLALAGCSSGGQSAESGAAQPSRADKGAAYDLDAQAAPPEARQLAPGDTSSVGGKVEKAKVAPAERSMIYKGDLTVRVKNIDDAAGKAAALAERLGGYVAADKRHREGDNSSADVTLRVPGKTFKDAVAESAKLGEELDRNYDTDDVTEAVVDIEARIASQQASVDRVRTLLSRAEKITDLASVERELAQRESELASLQAQARSLTGQVEYSTVTVHLVGPSAKFEKKDDDPTFLSALGAGWDALKAVVNGVLVGFGAALPFLAVLGLPLGLAFWLLRRRRRAQVGATDTPAEEPGHLIRSGTVSGGSARGPARRPG